MAHLVIARVFFIIVAAVLVLATLSSLAHGDYLGALFMLVLLASVPTLFKAATWNG